MSLWLSVPPLFGNKYSLPCFDTVRVGIYSGVMLADVILPLKSLPLLTARLLTVQGQMNALKSSYSAFDHP